MTEEQPRETLIDHMMRVHKERRARKMRNRLIVKARERLKFKMQVEAQIGQMLQDSEVVLVCPKTGNHIRGRDIEDFKVSTEFSDDGSAVIVSAHVQMYSYAELINVQMCFYREADTQTGEEQ